MKSLTNKEKKTWAKSPLYCPACNAELEFDSKEAYFYTNGENIDLEERLECTGCKKIIMITASVLIEELVWK